MNLYPATLDGIDGEAAETEVDRAFDDIDFGDGLRYASTPDDILHDNIWRAWCAWEGVRFCVGKEENDDVSTILGDFMGNFLHLCDAVHVDFVDIEQRGRQHYRPELAGEF